MEAEKLTHSPEVQWGIKIYFLYNMAEKHNHNYTSAIPAIIIQLAGTPFENQIKCHYIKLWGTL